MTEDLGGRRHELWHAQEWADCLAAVGSSAEGLTPPEAAGRLSGEGPNRLPATRERSPWLRFAMQFNNLLIYVLLGSTALSALLGHLVDAAVILAVVVVNALVGFLQEGRAERALDAIRAMINPRASVLRGGVRLTVPAEEVVRGDVVLLEAGDRVPADLRLLRARSLRIDEAVLTGISPQSQPMAGTGSTAPPVATVGRRMTSGV